MADLEKASGDLLERLTRVLEERKQGNPEQSYVAKLHHKGQDAILKKIGEESCELVMASKDQNPDKVIDRQRTTRGRARIAQQRDGLRTATVLSRPRRLH